MPAAGGRGREKGEITRTGAEEKWEKKEEEEGEPLELQQKSAAAVYAMMRCDAQEVLRGCRNEA